MAMMTAGMPAVRGSLWSRAMPGCASGAVKERCGTTGARRHKCAGQDREARDLRAFAARISASIAWTAGDSAVCLARQAGPGPRM